VYDFYMKHLEDEAALADLKWVLACSGGGGREEST
jgi:hypothetical protein